MVFIIACKKNAIKDCKSLKELPAEDRQLTQDEYESMIDVAPEYMRNIIIFAANTGFRKMEILNLLFGNLKFWKDKVVAELVETKSGNKEYVALSDYVVDLIKSVAESRSVYYNESRMLERF